VAPTTDIEVSRLIVVTHGGDESIEQILKQARKLVDVIEAVELPAPAAVPSDPAAGA